MANFAGYTPLPVPRFGSLVEWDDSSRLPLGVSAVCQHCRYTAEGIGSRWGMLKAFATGTNFGVSGLGLLKYSGGAKYQLVYNQDGKLFKESPAGSGTLVAVNPSTAAWLQAGYQAQMVSAYDNEYIAQSDLITGKARPLVFSGKNADVWPASDLPLATAWTAATAYLQGDIVSPVVPNGKVFRANNAGTSGGGEPAWPGDGGTVVDNGITWAEATPFMGIAVPAPPTPTLQRIGGGGTFAAGRDVYIKVTWVNGNGETDLPSQISQLIVNTVLNDAVRVTKPVTPSWNALLGAPQALTGWRVYEADVATGGAAPADAAFKLSGGTNAMGTATFDVTAAAAGAVGPTADTAWLAGPGNICAGVRWMIVLFENSNGYIDGCSDPMPVSTNALVNGRSIWVGRIPVGRANTVRRICAFTVAGDSRGGRYFYIPEDDQLYPNDVGYTGSGAALVITKTVIPDNATTQAAFNFIDPYLANLPTEVTDFFNKTMIPACSDAYFAKALNRMVYTGCVGFPSGHLVSEEADPETVMLPGGEVEVAEKDGDLTVAWREFRNVQYSLKQNSGHTVIPTGTNPQDWDAVSAWAGSGPSGPRAVDTLSTDFMVYVHGQSGVYLFTGGQPVFISPELVKTWARVNRGAKQTIWVKIYEKQKEIHIGLPLDGATKPNYRLRLFVKQWSELTEEPIVFSIRMGRLIPNVNGRKWSLDKLDANLAAVVERDLTVPIDARVDHEQILFASSANDGLVRYEVPGVYHDEDKDGTDLAIVPVLTMAPVDNPKRAVLGLGGCTISAIGSGQMNVSAVGSKSTAQLSTDKRLCVLGPTETFFDAVAKSAYDEVWQPSFTTDGKVDSWFELHHAIIYIRPAWAARRA